MLVKIGDFGNAIMQNNLFAKMYENIGHATHKAPEIVAQAEFLTGYDFKVDFWSLGICMF